MLSARGRGPFLPIRLILASPATAQGDGWTVLTNADVIRRAELMIHPYGIDAAARPTAYATELLASDEPAAAETWLRLKTAIGQLQASKPAPGGEGTVAPRACGIRSRSPFVARQHQEQ
jgi:hypothetical protein